MNLKFLTNMFLTSLLLLFSACKKQNSEVFVTTLPVSVVKEYSARCGVTVASNRPDVITAMGVCYGKNPQPSINELHTTDSDGTGTYESLMYGLDPGTMYYVRAYANSANGTEYGAELSFKTLEAWTSLPFTPQGTIYAMTASENCIFLGTANGILRSTDEGQTFVPVNNGLTAFNKTVYNIFVTGPGIFASTESGLFISTNNGDSWVEANNGLGNNVVNNLAAVGTNIFALTFSAGLFLSKDNGDNWLPVNNVVFSGTYLKGIAVSGTNIFLGQQFSGVFRSQDNGGSWTHFNQGLPSAPNITGVVVKGPNVYLMNPGAGIFKSTDNGNTWAAANNGLDNMSVFALVQTGNNLVLATLGGEIFLSTDDAGSWMPVGSGVPAGSSSSPLLCVKGKYVFMASNLRLYKRFFQ
jgi:photosystem II stability/assembly factor-like uncharacterized protein